MTKEWGKNVSLDMLIVFPSLVSSINQTTSTPVPVYHNTQTGFKAV